MPVQSPESLNSPGFDETGMAPKVHPLEPLSAAEVAMSVQLLKAHSVFTATTRIVSIMLREPDKALVHAWPQGALPERHAVAVLMDNGSNAASAVTLNLSSSRVIGVDKAPAGAQPTLSFDEQIECERAVLASPEFLAKLEEHYGITDSSLVMVDIWSAGNYGTEEDRTHRLARPLCFLRSDPTDNGYARPIEGLRPVVDLNTMQVLRV
jgi:primary-amine oxidase